VSTKTATFNLAAGETVKCTFTNRQKATIIVKKQTDPPGDPAQFTFTGKAAGKAWDGWQIVKTGLTPGTYTAQETVPSGWDLTSIVCDDANSTGSVSTKTATFRVAAGETVKCTFKDTKRGTLIVEKQTVPDGSTVGFSFSGAVSGTLTDGKQLKNVNVRPGTYTSTEAVKSGWGVTSIVCEDPTGDSRGDVAARKATFKLGPGETIKCTFTNTKR
jgi:plastocyanin